MVDFVEIQTLKNFFFIEFGDIYTWGWNESGQLGLPCLNFPDDCLVSSDKKSEDLERGDPVLVQALPHLVFLPEKEKDVIAIKVACGARHTAVLSGKVSNGKVFP